LVQKSIASQTLTARPEHRAATNLVPELFKVPPQPRDSTRAIRQRCHQLSDQLSETWTASHWQAQKAIDWDGTAEWFREILKWVSEDSAASPIEQVLEGLDHYNEWIYPLTESLDRSHSQFTPNLAERQKDRLLIEIGPDHHFGYIPRLAKVLTIRAIAAAEIGDGQRAFESILILIKFRKALSKGAGISSQRQGIQVEAETVHAIWETLRLRILDERQLIKLQEEWRDISVQDQLTRILYMEKIMLLEWVDFIKNAKTSQINCSASDEMGVLPVEFRGIVGALVTQPKHDETKQENNTAALQSDRESQDPQTAPRRSAADLRSVR
jgi:hypothetical protein